MRQAMEPTPAPLMLAKYGLAPSRQRGQNFLVDPNVARKVVAAARVGQGDAVIEIGPGFGAITFGLLEAAGSLTAVECDAGIVHAFREEYGEVPGLELIEGDALEVDLGEMAAAGGTDRLVVVGNIPYGVTSPLLGAMIEQRRAVARAVLMVQREVADRLAGPCGGSGASALSSVVSFHAEVKPLFSVRRTCFHPRPAVDSMVVEVDFERAPPRAADPGLYADVVHAAFAWRRKMLRRSLSELAGRFGLTAAELGERAEIDVERRGETLSVEEFEALALALSAGAPSGGAPEENGDGPHHQ